VKENVQKIRMTKRPFYKVAAILFHLSYQKRYSPLLVYDINDKEIEINVVKKSKTGINSTNCYYNSTDKEGNFYIFYNNFVYIKITAEINKFRFEKLFKKDNSNNNREKIIKNFNNFLNKLIFFENTIQDFTKIIKDKIYIEEKTKNSFDNFYKLTKYENFLHEPIKYDRKLIYEFNSNIMDYFKLIKQRQNIPSYIKCDVFRFRFQVYNKVLQIFFLNNRIFQESLPLNRFVYFPNTELNFVLHLLKKKKNLLIQFYSKINKLYISNI